MVIQCIHFIDRVFHWFCRDAKGDTVNKDNEPIVSYASSGNASTFHLMVMNGNGCRTVRLMRDTTGIPNVAFSRYYAYSGVTALSL